MIRFFENPLYFSSANFEGQIKVCGISAIQPQQYFQFLINCRRMGQNCTQTGQIYEFKTRTPTIATQLAQSIQLQQPNTNNNPFRHLSSRINERLSQLRYCLQDLEHIERHEVKRFPNGLYYQGMLENNEMNGVGRLIMPDGSYYQGSFSRNQINGEGILVDSQGFYYLGQFKNNKAEGNGKYVEQDFTYQGSFKQNVQSGFGKLVKNNEIYEGTFNKGKKKKGKLMKVSEGTVYEGAFQGNIENGFGRLALKDEIYEGIFHNGLIEGQAKMILANGETKTVVFKNGRKVELAKNESIQGYKSRAPLGHQRLIKTT